jgi:hypothetical protein
MGGLLDALAAVAALAAGTAAAAAAAIGPERDIAQLLGEQPDRAAVAAGRADMARPAGPAGHAGFGVCHKSTRANSAGLALRAFGTADVDRAAASVIARRHDLDGAAGNDQVDPRRMLDLAREEHDVVVRAHDFKLILERLVDDDAVANTDILEDRRKTAPRNEFSGNQHGEVPIKHRANIG